jgi:hypothetical protein
MKFNSKRKTSSLKFTTKMEQEITFKDLYSENSSFFYAKEYFAGMNNFWETTKFEIENGQTKTLDLGFFVFEQKEKDRFECLRGNKIDMITIQLSALFLNLRSKRKLNEEEIAKYAKYVKSKTKYRLDWIKEEKQMFRDYVIDQIEVDRTKMKTQFSYQFDNYNDYFSNKDEFFLLKWLYCIENATCTKIIQTGEKKPSVGFFIKPFFTATFWHSTLITLSKKR